MQGLPQKMARNKSKRTHTPHFW